jgi:hypothetical protein
VKGVGGMDVVMAIEAVGISRTQHPRRSLCRTAERFTSPTD